MYACISLSADSLTDFKSIGDHKSDSDYLIQVVHLLKGYLVNAIPQAYYTVM